MPEYGIVSSFFHSDLDVYGGTRRAPDRLPTHNRYFYEVWAELIGKLLGPDVPVVVVNNASPVRPDNFFAHFPNIEVVDNPDTRPQGKFASHHYNHNTALWLGFQKLKEKGVQYAGYLEQDVMMREKDWLATCVAALKQRGAKLATFELEDIKWVASELLVAQVDFWLEKRMLAPEVFSDEKKMTVEQLLMAQLKTLDGRDHMSWEGMRSTRDVHPDPCGVNGVRYIHHRNPTEVLAFLDSCDHDSPGMAQLKTFIRKSCLSA